jgi:hypothetical protein
MTDSPSPSTISVPRTLKIELMGFRLRSGVRIVLSVAESKFSISWGAMIGILIQVLLVTIERIKMKTKSFVDLAREDSKGYRARKPRGNLFRGERQEDASEILEVITTRRTSPNLWNVRNSRIRSEGQLLRGDPSYMEIIP